ncbi:prolyl-tRNA synthetase associated domain-containing protein [Pseudoalteromonas piscicida]|uniref:Ala-tRNA(Pro) hydrolase n=1 Tax=Pseudoalteromonas piscicida TaxID=43662 RepID=A0A2A5JK23_PSEO7|nr:prolyl-tRNA synthetase associated domain-containing protein [Pseudoalteromonas piscicida]PCK29780.1 Ala-tRNA(Pro) hydrolase [Pseudoalteromonas piscicida]
MIRNNPAVLAKWLAELNINYLDYDHPPLHTCLDADKLALNRQGTRLKNLFLRDNYGKRHFLFIIPADKQVDLKALSKAQGVSRLGFASTERLAKYLGVEQGCVSALALCNDVNQHVELWLDSELQSAQLWQCHPFVNTKTWVLTLDDLNCFWRSTGHSPRWIQSVSQTE